MKRIKVMKEWDKTWPSIEKYNILAEFCLGVIRRDMVKILDRIPNRVPNELKVLDIGCGFGKSLEWFKEYGFNDLIGIDSSETSVKICRDKGFNVIEMDAFHTKFRNKEFDLVYAGGVLEHFESEDVQLMIKEMCRISDKYILLLQPNKKSLYKKFADIYYFFIPERGPPELDYSYDYFLDSLAMNGFVLMDSSKSFLGGFWILLFERSDM
ncbi:MAG: class I SAM-dependent methyltransferase [Candidatus Methanoperedens sp.]